MAPDTDYSTWLTKAQAATALGVSPKQIERFAKSGKLQFFLWKRPSGGQSIAVYAPDDIDRLAHENVPSRPYVVPTDAAPPPNGSHDMQRQTTPKRSVAPVAPSGSALFQAFLLMFRQMSDHAQQVQTLFLTIPEAAKFSGLTEAYIRRACQEGKLDAFKDGGWKIRRTALVNDL